MVDCSDYCRRVTAILVCLSTVTASGTTVVVLRTPERIVVGADTLGYVSSQAVHECKIHRDGTILFAFANLIGDKKSGFSARTLARSAASGASIHDAAVRFRTLVLPAFAKALRRIQRDGPELYAKYFKSGPTPLSALFLGMEQGVPKFSLVAVKILDDTHGNMKLDADIFDCPGSYCVNGFGGTLLGTSDAASAAVKDPSVWAAYVNDPIPGAKRLIDIEIAAEPKAVGLPVDVVMVDSLGIHPVQVGVCHF